MSVRSMSLNLWRLNQIVIEMFARVHSSFEWNNYGIDDWKNAEDENMKDESRAKLQVPLKQFVVGWPDKH